MTISGGKTVGVEPRISTFKVKCVLSWDGK